SMMFAPLGSVVICSGDFKIVGMALVGDILAFLAAIAITGYFLLGQQLRRSLSLMTYTFIVYGTSSITLIIYNLILNNDFTGYTTNHWLIFLALAIFP